MPRLLHVRGGVSYWDDDERIMARSSPRPWRCFFSDVPNSIFGPVFSTSVEVFLVSDHFWAGHTGLLHVRGGVSVASGYKDMEVMSSPRPWRCFHLL